MIMRWTFPARSYVFGGIVTAEAERRKKSSAFSGGNGRGVKYWAEEDYFSFSWR